MIFGTLILGDFVILNSNMSQVQNLAYQKWRCVSTDPSVKIHWSKMKIVLRRSSMAATDSRPRISSEVLRLLMQIVYQHLVDYETVQSLSCFLCITKQGIKLLVIRRILFISNLFMFLSDSRKTALEKDN